MLRARAAKGGREENKNVSLMALNWVFSPSFFWDSSAAALKPPLLFGTWCSFYYYITANTFVLQPATRVECRRSISPHNNTALLVIASMRWALLFVLWSIYMHVDSSHNGNKRRWWWAHSTHKASTSLILMPNQFLVIFQFLFISRRPAECSQLSTSTVRIDDGWHYNAQIHNVRCGEKK